MRFVKWTPETGQLGCYPSLQGARNWFSPSARRFYIAVREMGTYYFKGESKYVPGERFMAGGEQRPEDGTGRINI